LVPGGASTTTGSPADLTMEQLVALARSHVAVDDDWPPAGPGKNQPHTAACRHVPPRHSTPPWRWRGLSDRKCSRIPCLMHAPAGLSHQGSRRWTGGGESLVPGASAMPDTPTSRVSALGASASPFANAVFDRQHPFRWGKAVLPFYL
jgi:hypothetical protein